MHVWCDANQPSALQSHQWTTDVHHAQPKNAMHIRWKLISFDNRRYSGSLPHAFETGCGDPKTVLERTTHQFSVSVRRAITDRSNGTARHHPSSRSKVKAESKNSVHSLQQKAEQKDAAQTPKQEWTTLQPHTATYFILHCSVVTRIPSNTSQMKMYALNYNHFSLCRVRPYVTSNNKMCVLFIIRKNTMA